MTAWEQPELEALVRQGDVELVALSDEQFGILLTDEVVPATPHATATAQAAMRSLVAAGHAEVADDGTVELVGMASLVRGALLTARCTLVLDDGSSDAPPTWVWGSSPVVLSHVWEPPGVHRFTACAGADVLRTLVSDLVPEGVPEDSEAFDWAAGDVEASARMEELVERSDGRRRLVLISGADEPRTSLTVLSNGDRPGWLVIEHPDGRIRAAPADRTALHRALTAELSPDGRDADRRGWRPDG